MTDVLELLRPSTAEITVYDGRVEVESLRFLDWFRFDAILTQSLTTFIGGKIADGLDLMGKAIELAAGLSSSNVDVCEALAAFVVLGELNELRYMDPDFAAVSKETEGVEDDLKNAVLIELLTTLVARFSMNEIESMTPEFAILCWQRIREEISADRDVVFFSTEMGYNKKWTSKKEGKYMLVPRSSPYTPVWQRRRLKKLQGLEREEMEGYVPKFVKGDVGAVVDAKTGRTLRDMGEVVEDE